MPEVLFNIPINVQDEQKLIALERRIAQINEEQKKLAASTGKATKAYQENALKVKQLRSAQTQLRTAILKSNQARKADLNTIGGINKALAEQRAKIQGIVIGSAEYKKVAANIKSLEDRQRAFNAELGRGRTFVGEYSKGFIDAFKNIALTAVGAYTVIRTGISVIKDAIDVNQRFEKTLANVYTLLDEQQKIEFREPLKEGALELMAKYGLTLEDVNKAMFDAISAGIPAGRAIEFLHENAVLAIGGVTDLKDAVYGTTAIMNAYGLSMEETSKVTSAFFTAQKFGVTTVAALTQNVGKTAAVAKTAGVEYKTLLATFAELTKQGVNTEESGTAIRQMLLALLKPTEQSRREFEKLGIATGASAIKQQGFIETLRQVAEAVKEDEDRLVELIPNVRALVGAGALGEEQLDELQKIVEKLNEDFGEGSSLMQGYNEQMQTAAQQSKVLKEEWNTLLIRLGGGESVFKKAGRFIRSELIDRVHGANETVTEFSEGNWLGKLGTVLNKMKFLFLGALGPVIKIIERITGKTIIPEIDTEKFKKQGKEVSDVTDKVTEDIIHNEEEVTEATDEETEKRSGILSKLYDRLKEEKEKKPFLVTEEELESHNRLVASLEDEIKHYENLGTYWEELQEKLEAAREKEIERELSKLEFHELENEEMTEALDFYEHLKKETTEWAKEQKKMADREKKMLIDRKESYLAFASEIGSVMGDFLKDQEEGFKEGAKSILITMIEFLERQIPVWVAQITGYSLAQPDSILTLGTTGLIRAAVITAILKGVAAVAKTAIAGFAESGVVTEGIPIQRANGDNRLVTAKVGEVYLNEKHQAMLGGPATFKALGIPGFAQSGVVSTPTVMTGQAFNLNYELLTEMLASKINDKQVVLNINELHDAEAERQVIEES